MSRKISDFFTQKSQKRSRVEEEIEEKIEGKRFKFSEATSLPEMRGFSVILEEIKFENFSVKSENIQLNKTEDKTSKGSKKSSYSCMCGKKYTEKHTLNKHKKNIHPELFGNSLLKCKICNLKFRVKGRLDLHMKSKHFNGEILKYECDFDGKCFKSKKEVQNHLKSHLPDIQCKICKAYLKARSFETHMKQTHATERNFQCKICEKNYKTLHLLNVHKKSHDKKYECEICKSTFSLNAQLKRHQKLYHENPGSFSCETCDRKFSLKAHLKTHEKTHDKFRVKPFKCQRCNYAVDARFDYIKHMKTHQRQDEKFAAMKNPQKCDKCPKFYRDRKALSDHVRIVHPKELFQCDLCGNYLTAMHSLLKHIKNHLKNK